MGVNRICKLTGQGEARFYDGGNTNFVTIKSPTALAGSYTLTLPPDDGVGTQFLRTDGAGVLTWGTATSSLDSAYANGRTVNLTTAVGSLELLAAGGTGNLTILDINKTNTGTGNCIDIDNDGTGNSIIVLQDGAAIGVQITQNGAGLPGLKVIQNAAAQAVLLDRPTGSEVLRVTASTSGNPYIAIVAGSAEMRVFQTASGVARVGSVNSHDMELFTNNTARFTITAGGLVGVGTATPQTPLEVSFTGTTALAARQQVEAVANECRIYCLTGTGAPANTNGLALMTATIKQADPSSLKSQLDFHTNSGDNLQPCLSLFSNQTVAIGNTAGNLGKLGVYNGTTDYGIYVEQTGGSRGLYINASTTSEVARITKTNAGVGVLLFLENLGTGNSIQDDSGAILTAAGVWTDVCASSAKEDFKNINEDQILSRLISLPLKNFRYKKDALLGRRYVTPMAEEFYAAFGLGDEGGISGTTLASLAIAGLKAIQSRLDRAAIPA